MGRSGLLVPIHPSKRVRDEIDESAWKAFTYKGKVWGYPLAMSVGLVVNRDLVKTVPTTFDEVMALDKELAKRAKKPFCGTTTNPSSPAHAGRSGWTVVRPQQQG